MLLLGMSVDITKFIKDKEKTTINMGTTIIDTIDCIKNKTQLPLLGILLNGSFLKSIFKRNECLQCHYHMNMHIYMFSLFYYILSYVFYQNNMRI